MNKRNTNLLAMATTLIMPALLLTDDLSRSDLQPSKPCPNCKRGRLQGRSTLLYCQRCSFTVDTKDHTPSTQLTSHGQSFAG